ncbi:hypothetical protein [Candidatus Uabimicrobium amorphum]|uniref:Uncharacterized protein n=1 Tax=Uabimicrobium amorphum TaxID=2596890 RepID=A0A5S9II23_UABAM|nr:hypothetical protein [Candidatus Uabimicrobium amorphum]BBM81940.1 hypothetical protein UABAM_00283 [Candidatus Uabimicrobium amorphum]
MDFFLCVRLIVKPKFILAFLVLSSFSFLQTQVISDVYRKKFYTQIPPTWIPPKQKLEIVKKTRKRLEKEWAINQVKIENVLPKKEIKALKCHPPFSMKITQKKPKKEKKSPRKEKEKLLLTFLLIVYPRSYRSIIEDPLEPPPIDYLGSTKLLAFYFYKPQTKKPKNKSQKKMEKEISNIFYLK